MAQQTIRIGMAGTPLNNGNLGCKALTYSAVVMLERVADELGCTFSYVFFDDLFDMERTRQALVLLCDEIGLEPSRAQAVPVAGWDRLRTVIRHPRLVSAKRKMESSVNAVDVIFDLTQGDSFTDIYDNGRRLTSFARVRDAAYKAGVPVILGPQTIGPFNTEQGRKIARRTLRLAALAIARDAASAECARDIAGIEIPVTTDLAFILPYETGSLQKSNKVRVGLNPSGLLVRNGLEGGLTGSELHTDYDIYLDRLCAWLDDNGYEVHLVPHVGGADLPVCQKLKVSHPDFVLHGDFETPIAAKSLIADLDVFVGSRMHATIAALSSGVPVVPVAYSRKFVGLFGSLGYDINVDLRSMTTEEALSETIRAIENYQELMPMLTSSRKQAEKLTGETCRILSEYLKNII
jgi:colanic acid/amylovoran biosynthesis protein